MTIKTTLLTLALTAATVAPAMAQTQFVTGLGYGTDRNQAMAHSIVAWTIGATQTFGVPADWNTALRGPLSCSQIQPSSGQYTTFDSTPGANIFTHGDIATATWSCSVEATIR